MAHQLALSPRGRLYLTESTDGSEIWAGFLDACSHSSATGLLAMAAARGSTAGWPAEAVFWREFARSFVQATAHVPSDDAALGLTVAPPQDQFFSLSLGLPAMRGAEYAGPEFFARLWQELEQAAWTQAQAVGGLRAWLHTVNPALHLLGRVTFHLAENKRSPATPFAFMATFTHRLSAQENPVHLPLARALQEYAGAKNKAALRALLEPVQRAADRSPWAREIVDSRQIFQPLAWSPREAHAFLQQAPVMEECGITVRIPNWWRGGRGPRPEVAVVVGQKKSPAIGLDALLSFDATATFNGEALSQEEWKSLMASQEQLVLLRGQWVEVDRDKLRSVLDHWQGLQSHSMEGISFLQGMRLLAGLPAAGTTAENENPETADWSRLTAGGWLKETLETLRRPEEAGTFDPNRDLHASLRPYQAAGVRWMWFLQSLGLGACLADDMGLGKTMQIIALLLQLRREAAPPRAHPSLLIAPASLLGNWRKEIARFAPTLRTATAHPSESPEGAWRHPKTAAAWMAGVDVVITTYTQATRLEWLATTPWRLIILDEAQAIKNPSTRQTKAVKKIKAAARIALSGTPVENSPNDLWSIFDFLNPGLLGSPTEFSRHLKTIHKAQVPNYAPLRRLVQPWILRRLKTDRHIIADLPDKTELTVSCSLSRQQTALYQESVHDLAQKLRDASGIQRRGLVLAFLMRFKQICNHPSQWLRDDTFDPDHSGKFARLGELAEEIASRQEKALVFTQFQEMTGPLAAYLHRVFGRAGLVLHGGTPVKKRAALVADFQRDDGPPFFVLSLKAGGSGLNLTAASHVFHFDRWWNPAVENQATDRAFRIGQQRNVLVHKFVCQGTLEERIDDMIREKNAVAESLLGSHEGAEKLLTEMDTDALLRFVSLDLKSVTAES